MRAGGILLLILLMLLIAVVHTTVSSVRAVSCLSALSGFARDGDGQALGKELQFEHSAPYGEERELMRHLGYRLALPAYDLCQERFRVLVPPSYSRTTNWGLLVWISPSDDARIPSSWESEFANQQLLVVAPVNAGNNRHAILRCRLALDAACNMARLYRIDPKRIYIGGFSGGGRIASIMGVAYADLFAGCLAMCGADFYLAVAAGNGELYPPTYRPDAAVLQRAKSNGRFVLLTGERDVNRLNTKSIAERGFKSAGFKQVDYLEIAGMSHSLPSANVLRMALAALE